VSFLSFSPESPILLSNTGGLGHLLLLSNLNLHSLLPKLSSFRLPTAMADRRLPRVGKSWSFVGGLFIQALSTLSHAFIAELFHQRFGSQQA
ncbi:hypothetical protein LINPERHAP2_LOCUS656, partial [Linum perenne]